MVYLSTFIPALTLTLASTQPAPDASEDSEDTAPASDSTEPASDSWDTDDDTPPASTPADPPPDASDAADDTAPAPAPTKKKAWAIHVAPGYDYFTFKVNDTRLTAMGGSFRFGAHKSLQIRGFYIAGGPILNYTYFTEVDKMGPADKLHLATLNADMLIGGGGERVVGYAHLTAGLGVLGGQDGETDTKITTFGARAAAGAGMHVHVTPRVSLGALFDVGWAGVGIWLNPMLTLNIHFPQTPR